MSRTRVSAVVAASAVALALVVAALVAVGAVPRGPVVAPAPSPSSAPVPESASARPPEFGLPLYVDPANPAARARAADPSAAPELDVIAGTPQAKWFTESTPADRIEAEVREYTSQAASAGALPVLVAYAVPGRDCGGFSAGGLPSSAAYGDWIRRFALGIDRRPAVVVLEPDALTAFHCLTAAQRVERTDLLKRAVTALTTGSDATVYVDGGHSHWLSPSDLAARLRSVGIGAVGRARGFSLNVSNFYPTADQVAYGEQVSALLGGAHYVVDTSRNGLGPAPDGPLNWCNPPGRALGVPPTTTTGGAHADAYLWIKNPGQSDGSCDRGDPASGLWFDSYALALVRLARVEGVPTASTASERAGRLPGSP